MNRTQEWKYNKVRKKMKQFEDDEPPEEILEYEREEDIVWYINIMDHLEQARLIN